MMKITNGALTSAVTIGIVASIVGVALNLNNWAVTAASILLASIPLWSWRHQSLGELILAKRRHRRLELGYNVLFEHSDAEVATSWGNNEMAAYLQLESAPFELTVLVDPTSDADSQLDATEPGATEPGAGDSDVASADTAGQDSTETPPADDRPTQPIGIIDDNDTLAELLGDTNDVEPASQDNPGPDADTPDADADEAFTYAETRLPAIPVSTIAGFLTRAGITVARHRIISNGFLTATESDLARDYLDHIPLATIPPISHVTVIESSVSMLTSLQAIYSRMSSESVLPAAQRTAYVTSIRLRNALSRHRIYSHILPADEVGTFHDRVLDTLNESLAYEGPNSSGADTTTTATWVAATPHPEAITSSYEYGRTITTTTDLTGTGLHDARIDTAITIASPATATDALDPPPAGTWYRPRYRQALLQARAVPMAVAPTVSTIPTHPLPEDYDTALPVHGAGVYLGQNPAEESVFLSVARGGRVLWMCGATWHLNSLILRASHASIPICVSIPSPESPLAKAIEPCITELNCPWVGTDELDETGGILIIDADSANPPHPIPANVAVIAYSPRSRPEAAPYLLYPVTEQDYIVKSLSHEEEFRWELTPAEYDLIDSATPAGRHAQ